MGKALEPIKSNPANKRLAKHLWKHRGQLFKFLRHKGIDAATGSTPAVRYGYSDPSTGGLLTSETYPNGRVLNYNYGSVADPLDQSIGRLSSISDSSGTLEAHQYLSLSTLVTQARGNGVSLTYLRQPGDTLAGSDGGDQYTGLDRFGRVVDQNWVNTATGASVDRFQYGYDRNSNPLSRNNPHSPQNSELYAYDGLNRLTNFARGTLSASIAGGTLDTVASPSHTQMWNLDAVGNQTAVTTDGATQTRSSNLQNQLTSVGAATLAFDNNGNTTTDEHGHTSTYDAWNRLASVKDAGGNSLAGYTYDAMGRRVTEAHAAGTTTLYYSASWQVVEERQGGVAVAQNVWSPMYVDALIERDQTPVNGAPLSQRLWAEQDANYNVTSLTDSTGTVVERYVYDPCSSRKFDQQSIALPDGFAQ